MDPLAAGLAIPAAIKAAMDIIDRLLRSSKTVESELNTSFRDARRYMESVEASLRHFTYVTSDLKPWKYAHHCTNIIMYTEMVVLFKTARSEIQGMVTSDPKKVEVELEKAEKYDSSRNYIMSKQPGDLDIPVPKAVEGILAGRPWYEFVTFSIDELNRTFQKRDGRGFFKTLYLYRDVVVPINHSADNVLLRGLERISDRLDEIRSQLPESNTGERT